MEEEKIKTRCPIGYTGNKYFKEILL